MRNLAHSWDVCVLTKTMDQCLAQVDTGVLKINIPNSPNNLENKFFYNSVVLVSGGTYFITASRKKIGTTSDALDGDPCSNQLGDCYQPDCGVIQGDPTLRSGAMLCHLPNGTFTIGGWGLYQGI
jgi:hypothetical protein